LCFVVSGQGKFTMPDKVKKECINFKLLNNLIIVSVNINGKEGSYILDTGVSTTILFKTHDQDISDFNETRKISLSSFGYGEPIEAIVSHNNYFQVGKITGVGQKVLILLDEQVNFSSKLGMTINGIIGSSFFRDFVIKINYVSKTITCYKPELYKVKRGKSYQTFPLEFHNGKPYVTGNVVLNKTSRNVIPVKLLVDTGGTDALWLFEDEANDLKVPEKNFRDFFGEGLTGSLYCNRAKITLFYLGKFNFQQMIVSFLEKESTEKAREVKDRRGSLGGELLKRFTVWINYRDYQITLKKNKYYREKFYYNMSGLEINYGGDLNVMDIQTVSHAVSIQGKYIKFDKEHQFELAPTFVIENVREGSPGAIAGVKKGDILLGIDGIPTRKLTFGKISDIFYRKKNKTIRLKIERYGVEATFMFKLINELD